MIAPQHAEAFYPLVLSMLENPQSIGNADAEEFDTINSAYSISAAGSVFTVSEFGLSNPPENAPKDSVVVLPITGAITKYDQMCGSAGTTTKLDLLTRAVNNPNVKAIVQVIDSPGGDGAATEFYVRKAQQMQSVKPIVTFVSGMACSAGYWLALAGQHIMMEGKTSEVGSVGAYTQVPDFTKFYEDKGVKIHKVYAPQSTLKNKGVEDLLKGDNKAILQDLETFTDFFINEVKDSRPETANSKPDIFKGACFYAEEAIDLKMADSIGSFDDAIAKAIELADNKNATNSTNNTKMFGNKYPKLHALSGVEADKISEEQLTAANNELTENGVSALTLVLSADLNEYQNELNSAKSAAQEAQNALNKEKEAHEKTKADFEAFKNSDAEQKANLHGEKDKNTDSQEGKEEIESKPLTAYKR